MIFLCFLYVNLCHLYISKHEIVSPPLLLFGHVYCLVGVGGLFCIQLWWLKVMTTACFIFLGHLQYMLVVCLLYDSITSNDWFFRYMCLLLAPLIIFYIVLLKNLFTLWFISFIFVWFLLTTGMVFCLFCFNGSFITSLRLWVIQNWYVFHLP